MNCYCFLPVTDVVTEFAAAPLQRDDDTLKTDAQNLYTASNIH